MIYMIASGRLKTIHFCECFHPHGSRKKKIQMLKFKIKAIIPEGMRIIKYLELACIQYHAY